MKVCPNPTHWNNIYKKFSEFADENNLPKPPVPLILNGWVFTNDLEKKIRWEKTIDWARSSGCSKLLEKLSKDHFYYTTDITAYQIGPYGGPMYQPWDYETKVRPKKETLEFNFFKLQSQWPNIAVDIAHVTKPVAFTGKKARRLLVNVLQDSSPPWGDWDRLSYSEEKRRSFTKLRQDVNRNLNSHKVDHIDFM